MNKCECWCDINGVWAECWGTRERDACSCGGDKMKCDFYPEVRERAKNVPDIRAAITYYNKGINEDIFSPEVATYARLAVEALKRWEAGW